VTTVDNEDKTMISN